MPSSSLQDHRRRDGDIPESQQRFRKQMFHKIYNHFIQRRVRTYAHAHLAGVLKGRIGPPKAGHYAVVPYHHRIERFIEPGHRHLVRCWEH